MQQVAAAVRTPVPKQTTFGRRVVVLSSRFKKALIWHLICGTNAALRHDGNDSRTTKRETTVLTSSLAQLFFLLKVEMERILEWGSLSHSILETDAQIHKRYICKRNVFFLFLHSSFRSIISHSLMQIYICSISKPSKVKENSLNTNCSRSKLVSQDRWTNGTKVCFLRALFFNIIWDSSIENFPFACLTSTSLSQRVERFQPRCSEACGVSARSSSFSESTRYTEQGRLTDWNILILHCAPSDKIRRDKIRLY